MDRRTFLAATPLAAASLPRPARAQGSATRKLKLVTPWPKDAPGLSSSANRLDVHLGLDQAAGYYYCSGFQEPGAGIYSTGGRTGRRRPVTIPPAATLQSTCRAPWAQ